MAALLKPTPEALELLQARNRELREELTRERVRREQAERRLRFNLARREYADSDGQVQPLPTVEYIDVTAEQVY